jgi:indole-3-glycerol phosphate synthase/phosphoribosylanthranilate isomerase
MNLLERIVARRRERVGREGPAMGASLPARRRVPFVPFLGASPALRHGGARRSGALICEIKRRSPSRGDIAPGLDAVAQAGRYAAAGVRFLSVLTEEDHFGGSLADLMAVKERFPHLAVLRKDFLLDEEDLEASARAGADAVLLLAALHDGPALRRLRRCAEELGLAALVEVHDRAEVYRAREARPALTGVNSRDLCSFRVDPLAPLALRPAIDWDTTLVYESGVKGPEGILLARCGGFDAVLVGEAAVRSPEGVGELQAALDLPLAARGFWARVAARLGARLGTGQAGTDADGYVGLRAGIPPASLPGSAAGLRADEYVGLRPLVKICGLTRAGDARLAAGLGADLLGFVFAPSPRRAEPALLRELAGLNVLKMGVVTEPEGTAQARALLEQGLLDALQLHGEEPPAECLAAGFPYVKALRLREPADVARAGEYACPRVLADAWTPAARGGTGCRVPEELVGLLAEARPLWLAGGLGPDNIREVVRRWHPELVDASSRLEASPGVKDRAALERFFAELAAGGEE